MNDATDHPTPNAPRETLAGDRLCVQCMHPLVGRAIERDAQTGLLFVRCGECGTASALFEYPTVAPWVRRFKTVAASTFAIIAVGVIAAMIAVSGIFTGAASNIAAEECASEVVLALQSSGGALDESEYAKGIYTDADLAWLSSDAGARALRDSRRSLAALLPFLTFTAIGTILLVPFALTLGVVLMRRHALERAAVAMLFPLVGAGVAYAILATEDAMRTAGGFTPSWSVAVYSANYPHFALMVGAWFPLAAATTALLGPTLLAAFFRFVLPPSDRRLVAWMWEWRGKPVPRD